MIPFAKLVVTAGCWLWSGHGCKPHKPAPLCTVYMTPDGAVVGIQCKNGVEPAWVVVPSYSASPVR